MTRRDAQDTLKAWLKDFIVPAGAVLVTATGAWMRMEHVASEHDRRLAQLEASVARVFSAGPDGFSDPFLHSTHDLYLRHAIEDKYVTTDQWGEWRRSFFQLNPSIISPTLDALGR
jgi:hypothetical protein